MSDLNYTEVLEAHEIKIPYVKEVISDRMAHVIGRNRYEASEVKLLRKLMRPRDRVLELGAGVGVVSTCAAQIARDPSQVLSIEANPNLIPIIRETHRLNGVEGVEVVNGLGVGRSVEPDETIPFYLREHFWASSMSPLDGDDSDTTTEVSVPLVNLNALIKAHRPSILVMDIEGAEADLLPQLDLSSVRSLVVELHPRVYQNEGTARCSAALAACGFTYDARRSRGGTVVVFTRHDGKITHKRRVCAVTCMKDEGPFILEWIAYHQMVGITDFLIFSNDCSDGTTEILDRLDAMGHVRHLPNPSMGLGTRHQPTALQYSRYHREVTEADWSISMDVDEFINVHVGNRTLDAFFDAHEEANFVSLCHLDFGCAGIETYEDTPIIEQMQRCAVKQPEAKTKRRGIKTFIRKDAPDHTVSNHRPKLHDPDDPKINWMDGGGRTFPRNRQVGEHKGMQPHGAYAEIQLNHYPVRSMETYLTKSIKGNVIAKNAFVGIEYWENRNQNADEDSTIQPLVPATKQRMSTLLSDPILRDLHQAAVRYHREQVATLRAHPDAQALLNEIKASHENPALAEDDLEDEGLKLAE